MVNTFFALMAEFNQAHVPVTEVAKKYYDHDEITAKRYAAKGKYPFPVFRLEGQGSKWMVAINDLADYTDKARDRAAKDLL
jgi:hypothetical protein